MQEVSTRYQNELPRIKKLVNQTREVWDKNYKRFNFFQKFIFDTSLTSDWVQACIELSMPVLEFNVSEAYISRLCGEFSKQEPSVSVSLNPLMEGQTDPQIIKVVEGYLRNETIQAKKNQTAYKTYREMLSGGFSAMKIWTEYASPKSFHQVIRFGKVHNPVFTGFDSLAKEPGKTDGRFCYEIFPKSPEDMKAEYGIDVSMLKFSQDLGDYTWAYQNDTQKVVLLCNYFERKKKRIRIVQLANGQVMTTDEYKQFLEDWHNAGIIQQPPAIVGKPSSRTIDVICQYLFIDNQVLEYKETDFPCLPIVFFDGNSAFLPDGQMTRPYAYHLKDTQMFKNLAMRGIANDLENCSSNKYIAALEGIPEGYEDNYRNPQQYMTLPYRAYKEDEPDKPLPPPQVAQRVPLPPEFMAAAQMADQLTQTILGSYDASLGINDNQLSGVAIVEGATQSNAAAMPYVVNYMQGFSKVLQIIADMMPRYMNDSRHIPTMGVDRQQQMVPINQQGGLKLQYEDGTMIVNVEAGVNFQIQKSRTLQQITGLAQAMPIFGSFMNELGLKVLVENLDIHGADQLAVMADQYMQQLQQQKQQQSQQPNPMMMKEQNHAQEIMLRAQQQQDSKMIESAKLGIAQQDSDNERMKILSQLQQTNQQNIVDLAKQQTEKARAATDLAIQVDKHHHDKHVDVTKLHLEAVKHLAKAPEPTGVE